jgi:hypothetical protein
MVEELVDDVMLFQGRYEGRRAYVPVGWIAPPSQNLESYECSRADIDNWLKRRPDMAVLNCCIEEFAKRRSSGIF